MSLYGGFAGTETQRDQRNPAANVTIIDGTGLDNSVITANAGITTATVIDGFTIQDGVGRLSSGNRYGGGIDCNGGSPTINNNIISGNTATIGGGIFAAYGTSPSIQYNSIQQNQAKHGAGVHMYHGVCSHNTITFNQYPTGSGYGGGVKIGAYASGQTTVSYNHIIENSTRFGGGIATDHSSPTISNNLIKENHADEASPYMGEGGGIYVQYGSPEIMSNDLHDNHGGYYGGGISMVYASGATVQDNNILRNDAEESGGIDLYNGSGTVANNIVADNTGVYDAGGIQCAGAYDICNNTIAGNSTGEYGSGGGLYLDEWSYNVPVSNNVVAFNSSGVYRSGMATCTLKNNDVYGNTAYDYSGFNPPPTGQNGNISVDPQFMDRMNSDYHLQSTSECIGVGANDAPGIPSTDMDNGSRVLPSQGTVDIGADEYEVVYYFVDGVAGNDESNDGRSWQYAEKTIGAAITDALSSGEVRAEVWVKAVPGGYHEYITLREGVCLYGGFSGVEENRDGRDPAANVTIIDGTGLDKSVVTANTGITRGTIIDGFTIQGGAGRLSSGHRYGGGIDCNGGSPTIMNNVTCANTLTANPYSGYGGGIACIGSAPRIAGNTVTGNSVQGEGGGLYVFYGSPEIVGNDVHDNDCTTWGGGMSLVDSAGASVLSNRVVSNDASDSGGIDLYNGSGTVANNIVADNSASVEGGGIQCYMARYDICNNTVVGNTADLHGGGIFINYILADPVPISNNIVAFNSSGIYNLSSNFILRNNDVYSNSVPPPDPNNKDYEYTSPGVGEIRLDPEFVNQAAGDYHLLSSSPCIGAGLDGADSIPLTDMDGGPRTLPVGGHVDIGADEYDSTPPTTPIVTDDGESTTTMTLHATWSSTDPESGIAEYQYAIGTSAYPAAGWDSVLGWTSAGTATEVTRSDLNLTNGLTYYFSVKARNRGSLWSEVGVSDGITVNATVATPIFDPPGGTEYCDCLGVTITCETPGVTIRYTVSDTPNGPDPDQNSTLYDPLGVAVIDPTETLKAKAFKAGWNDSPVASATYSTEGCGSGGGSPGNPPDYTCWDYNDVDPPEITNLRLDEIAPGMMHLDWSNSADGGFDVQRNDQQQWVEVNDSEHTDNSGFDLGTRYVYKVRARAFGGNPPAGLQYHWDPAHIQQNCTIYGVGRWGTGLWKEISVVPQRVVVSENQTVDSRADTRYVEDKRLDFQFGNRIYRGGLFVGNADDPSKVGRSFLKFDLTGLDGQMGTNDRLWTANLEAHYTRSFDASMSTDVGCHFLPNDAWDEETVVWSTAPAIDPANAKEPVTVSGTDSSWYHWVDAFPGFVSEMYGDGTLTLGLASKHEDNSGWAYFAKKEYNADLAPHILYAYGNYPDGGAGVPPIFVVAIDLDSSAATGGSTVGGTLWLNVPAPANGKDIALSVNGCVARVPNPIHVPEGELSASFIVSTAIVSSPTDVTISAFDSSTTLRINP